MKKLTTLLFICCTYLATHAQKVTVSGKITDAGSGEGLIGATVVAKGTGLGTATNGYGFYSLTLDPGKVILEYSYVGFESVIKELNLKSDSTINIELGESADILKEAVVNAKKKVENKEISVVNMDIKTIKEIPVIFGEVDVLKTITLMPGIQSAGEGNSGINVRGGSQDQNLILLDEATVYNASHLLGFFSVFNGDAIKDIEVYKGGIPAAYGGRLASLIDIKMKDGNRKKFGATGGIGTISSRLTLEGPIVKDKSSFMIAGRRSYADIFLPLAGGQVAKDSRLYFYDLNMKANYELSDKDKIYLSGYFGRDVFGFGSLFGVSWGNATSTLRWNHIFNKKLFLNTSFVFSDFNYGFNFEFAENASFGLEQKIRDYYIKPDFSYYLSPNSTLRFGGQLTKHRFNPGTFKANNDATRELFKNDIVLEQRNALEGAVYIDHDYKFSKKFNVRYGLRISSFANMGGTEYSYTKDANYQPIDSLTKATHYKKGEIYNIYGGLEPRLAVSYNVGEQTALKGTFNRTFQYIQQASNTASAFPTDQWFSSNLNIKPQRADQVAVGIFKNFPKGIEGSFELYYKWMKNQIDYRNGANLAFNEKLDGELLLGKGHAYGSEWYLSKPEGRTTGFISYTLARTTRQTNGINFNKVYSANYDIRHNLSVVISRHFTSRLTVAATFIYTSGKPFTPPVGKYFFEGKWNPYYGERNNYRIPAYHRADIGITWKNRIKPNKKFKSSWNFSVYNFYNRANAYAIYFREATDKEVEENPNVNAGDQVAVKVTLFKMIPSLTWNFEF
ncbi:MAG: TonB-dependent receptor plug domain-containing protein [Bacteroidetes bacterium]|nr:TonB-dependent receptor plug domain-containing protein [Bacteroidota bacterium]